MTPPKNKKKKSENSTGTLYPKIRCAFFGEKQSNTNLLNIVFSEFVQPAISEDFLPTCTLTFENSLQHKVDMDILNIDMHSQCVKKTELFKMMNVLVLFFSLTDPASLNELEKTWLPKIKKTNKKLKIILVGTGRDVRDSLFEGTEKNKYTDAEIMHFGSIVKTAQGKEAAKQMGVMAYLECFVSFLDKSRLEDSVKTALYAVLNPNAIFSEYRVESSQQEEKKEKPFKH